MTTMTQATTAPDRVRTAMHRAVCAARGCLEPIQPRQQIVKRPGGAWAHADCTQPWQGVRGRERRPVTGRGHHHDRNDQRGTT